MAKRDQQARRGGRGVGGSLLLLGLLLAGWAGWWSLGTGELQRDRPRDVIGDTEVPAEPAPVSGRAPRVAVTNERSLPNGGQPTASGGWTGRVLSADAVPLVGVSIRLGEVGVPVEATLPRDESRASGGDGRFTVPAVPGFGPTRLLVFADREHAVVGVALDRAGDLGDLRLPRPGTLTGRLTGASAAHLAVRCDPVGEPGALATPLRAVARRVPVAADGTFTVEQLAPGHYALAPDAPGRTLHAARCHVEVVAAGEVDVGELRCVASRELTGRVTDVAGRPVAGAAAQLRAPEFAGWPPLHLRSGADGSFTFREVPDVARLSLRVAAAGYRAAELSGAALLGPGPIRVRLDPGLAIAGVVVDAADGAPVTDFQVMAVPVEAGGATAAGGPLATGEPVATGGSLPAQPEEHPDGRFEVAGLEAGWYEVHAVAPGYVRGRSAAVEVGGAQRPDVRIVVARGLRYAGVLVLEPGGRALGGARIRYTLRGTGSGPLFHGQTNSSDDGRFAIDGLRAGTYDFAIGHRSLGAEHRDELVLTDSLEDQRVAVPAPAWLSGRVVGLAVGEASRATVRAVGGAGRTRSAAVEPDVEPDGRYRLGPLPAGSYAVRAFVVPLGVHRLAEPGLAADAAPESLPVDCVLAAGEERRFDLSVTRYPVGALRGVVRVDGVPLAGVLVGVPRSAAQARTDAEGSYRLDDLLVGRVELRIELPGGRERERVFVTAREVVAGASPVVCDFEVGTGVLRGRLVGEGWPQGAVTAVWEVDGDGTERHWNPLLVRIEDGRFEVDAVPAGAGRLVVPVRGARPVVQEAVVPPGALGVDLELVRD